MVLKISSEISINYLELGLSDGLVAGQQTNIFNSLLLSSVDNFRKQNLDPDQNQQDDRDPNCLNV